MRPRLLLIVDDWEALDRYELELEGKFDLLPYPIGKDGILAARELKPDLLFLDLTLEDMTPREALALLAADPATQGIPTLAIVDEELRGSPHVATLRRPFRMEELAQKILALAPSRSSAS